MKKLTLKEFIERAMLIHGDKYNYSLVDYINSKIKVKIICPIHGEFLQTPNDHLSGAGCNICGGTKNKYTEIFIEEVKLVHGNKYDYSLVDYINSKIKVKIICPIHGEFLQTPNDHLSGIGCGKCKGYNKTTEIFIEEVKLVHGNKYDYSLVDYKSYKSKVKIICHIHGEFTQTPNAHLNGNGCPNCCESKGEKEITKILTEMSIEFERQKRFNDCRNVRPLPFDFYIENTNTAIEFQGKQHYKVIEKWGGAEGLIYRQTNDKIKKEYCTLNGIKLIEINNIKEISEKIKTI